MKIIHVLAYKGCQRMNFLTASIINGVDLPDISSNSLVSSSASAELCNKVTCLVPPHIRTKSQTDFPIGEKTVWVVRLPDFSANLLILILSVLVSLFQKPNSSAAEEGQFLFQIHLLCLPCFHVLHISGN